MPQIWLSYEEMGHFRDMTPQDARAQAQAADMPRRHCSDGITRIKLPADLTDGYLVHALVERNLAHEATSTAIGGQRAASPFDRLADSMSESLRRVAGGR